MPKILIVEDEQAIRDSVEFFLSNAGYEVETAVSSQDALTLSNRFCPDILIVDWVLTDSSDGLEVAAKRQEKVPHLRVIVTSRYPLKTFEEQVTIDPSTQYLSKPFGKGDIIAAVQKALELPEHSGT